MIPGPENRHLSCSICSDLSDREYAQQTVRGSTKDTFLPEAADRLDVVREMRPGWLHLKRCPECGTYYLWRTVYEYLIGYDNGSCDEYFLTRLTDEVGADYREGRRSEPVT